jgi:hypothetical protein
VAGYSFLVDYLRDPDGAMERERERPQENGHADLAETRSMWQQVIASDLSPEDQAKAERIGPIVTAYLTGEIDRSEYERRLAGG